MIRRILYCLVFNLIVIAGYAQQYGNEWIDYNKQYYKIPVAQEGIYRLSYAGLVAAGFPVASVDPRRLQLFHRGTEQAIYVEGQGDAVFNATDFIEFYGHPNDGFSDRELYQPQAAQPHQLYNIYTDTTAYFLTYNLMPVNGKRMASFSGNNIDNLPAENAHSEKITKVNTDQYSRGRSFNTNDVTKYSYFDYGEGWTGAQIQEGQSIDYTLNGFSLGVSGSEPELRLLLVGRDDLAHQAEIFVGPNAGSLRSLGIIDFDQYETYLFQTAVNWADIDPAGEILIRIQALGVDGGNDRLSVSYIQLTYPQEFNMQSANSKKFLLAANPVNSSYIEVQDVPDMPQIYDITDPANVVRIGHNIVGAAINAMVDNTAVPRTLWINGSISLTPAITKVSFTNIAPADFNYLIISHPLLMNAAGDIPNPVQEYAAYRASVAGGAYNVLVANIRMLYNQFNYGEISPMAIYRFMRFMVDQGSQEYLFLIGKGLDPAYNFHRSSTGYFPVTKFGEVYQVRDLVPSAGTPGSDMAFTAGLDGTTFESAVPVGRLPAVNANQVLSYLNKVKETEALPFDDLWKKNILHLSGGITTAELSNFRGFMDGFAAIAESKYLGGQVKTVTKETNSTVELINVADEVNNGLSLITFYGHSAPSVTDIDIGYVSDPLLGYNNSGKYPMFLVNGCNAGQFFNANILFGEDWILAADKGAVGFIAHSSFGFASHLRKYSDVFYSTAYGDSVFISKTIGSVQQEVTKRYMSTSAATPAHITQVQQMVLLGDPALKLFGPEEADYEVNDNHVFLAPFNEPISAEADSFALKAIVQNFGRVNSNDFGVRVTRTMSDNTVAVYDTIFPAVYYKDTVTVVIKNEALTGFGSNDFLVELDYLNVIDELDEGNNSAELDAFIPLYGTKNLYPLDFAIVASQPVDLLVQATDISSTSRNFLIEIDTVKTFNSPFKKQTSVQADLLANWQVELLSDIKANDSTVYFWRSKFAQTAPGENDEWSESSFIYIKDSPEGWSQSKFGQYDQNQLNGLGRDEVNQEMKFMESEVHVAIRTYGANHSATNTDVSVALNGAEYITNNGRSCRDNTVNLIAFDKSSMVPYAAIPFDIYDIRSCGRLPQLINSFTLSELESGADNLLTYIDKVNDGDSVVLFTIGDVGFSSWSAAVKSKLEEIGASTAALNALQDGEPYILLGRKVAPAGTAREIKAADAPADEQQIVLDETLTGVFSSGSMMSSFIGPSSQWQSLHSYVSISETPQTDVFGIDVIGITSEGREQLLRNGETAPMVDLSTIDAIQYPFLQLKYDIEDDVNLTPAQLQRWQVLYTGVPEGILLVDDDTRQQKEKAEGESVEATFGFKNLSIHDFPDSLRVLYTLFNQDNRTSEVNNMKIKAPSPGDTSAFVVNINTLGKAGVNDVNVFVNPQEWPEQYLENNVFDQKEYLIVNRDNINPLIDVVFDGNYILNGDIVSPSPLISIRIKDENEFIFKKDTMDINIFLKKPCETGPCEFKRIAFSSEQVLWFPADDERDFRIEYQPERLENGIYTLRVDAKDASGNDSGSEPYAITFEVINESSITNFYPYPNPFSSNTRFIFTLTGSEVPDEVKIQIMTVSGKIVREITQQELGPLRIGNNISDFAWNGRDEFGDQLANGVYLYRVMVRQNGQALDHRDTSADRAFKNGYGKIYLLR